MKQREINLLATLKTADTFGDTYAADFPADSVGGKQFALIKAAVTATADLGAAQVSGGQESHEGVVDEAALRLKLHTVLLNINKAAHSSALLGVAGLDGKFHMPRHDSDQELLNMARSFAADAVAFKAQFVSLNLADTFIDDLNQDISDFENALKAHGSGVGKRAGATSGIGKTIRDAAIALHVLNTIVPNTYKDDPEKLAEWVVASHVERHTPVPRVKPAPAPATINGK